MLGAPGGGRPTEGESIRGLSYIIPVPLFVDGCKVAFVSETGGPPTGENTGAGKEEGSVGGKKLDRAALGIVSNGGVEL